MSQNPTDNAMVPAAMPAQELMDKALDGVRLGSMTLTDPGQVVAFAQKMAEPLAQLIEERRLFVTIGKKKHVYVEGWATCGAMLGVTPRLTELYEDTNNPGEFVATVEAIRADDGAVVGRAQASCGPDERDWSNRSRQARRSMAQTRATGKVFRLLFSWVMNLAGYDVTPFEEMDSHVPEKHDNPPRNSAAPAADPRKKRAEGPVTVAEHIKPIHERWCEFEWQVDFVEWVQSFVGRKFDVRKPSEWTHIDVAKIKAELWKGVPGGDELPFGDE